MNKTELIFFGSGILFVLITQIRNAWIERQRRKTAVRL